MNILKGKESDLISIMKLIKDAIDGMYKSGIDQWNEHYPNVDIIKKDIEDENLYVAVENDDYLGIIVLNEEQDPEYKGIKWLSSTGKNLVVHRLCINVNFQRRGVAQKLIEFAEEFARKDGYISIRLDTYSANPKALRLYEKLSYSRLGEIHFPYREKPFYCFEKLI